MCMQSSLLLSWCSLFDCGVIPDKRCPLQELHLPHPPTTATTRRVHRVSLRVARIYVVTSNRVLSIASMLDGRIRETPTTQLVGVLQGREADRASHFVASTYRFKRHIAPRLESRQAIKLAYPYGLTSPRFRGVLHDVPLSGC